MRIAQSLSRAMATRYADFFLPGLFALVVIEVAGVVAELVDVRRESLGEPVVLLQVDDEVGFGLPADFGDGVGFGGAIDGDADDVGAGVDERVCLGDGGVDVARLRGRHALDGDGIVGADGDRADADGAGWVAGDRVHFSLNTNDR